MTLAALEENQARWAYLFIQKCNNHQQSLMPAKCLDQCDLSGRFRIFPHMLMQGGVDHGQNHWEKCFFDYPGFQRKSRIRKQLLQ
jgi:hypothetical protein